MRGGMNHSFPVEVDGETIGRVSRGDDGRWTPRDIARKRHGIFESPAQARAALIEAVERWKARDVAEGRPQRSYGHRSHNG